MLDSSKDPFVLLHGVFDNKVLDLLEAKNPEKIFLLEGRPYLDGLNKTYPQLKKRKLPVFIIADNMPGFLFHLNMVSEVWVAGDKLKQKRIDCPVGSLVLAILAKHHHRPFFVYKGKKSSASKRIMKNRNILRFLGQDVSPKKTQCCIPLIDSVSKNMVTKVYG